MFDLTFLTHSLGVKLPTDDPQEVVELLYMLLHSSALPKLRENEFFYYLSLEPAALMLLHGGSGEAFTWKLNFLRYLQEVDTGTWVENHLNHLADLCLSNNLVIPT